MGIAVITLRTKGKAVKKFTAKNFITTDGMEALLKATFLRIQPKPMYHDVTNSIYLGGLYIGAIVQTDGTFGGSININDTWLTKRWLDWPSAGGKIYSWNNVTGGCLGFLDGTPPPQYAIEIGQLPYSMHTYLNVGACKFAGFPDPVIYGTSNHICQGLFTGVLYDTVANPSENSFELFSIIPFATPITIPTSTSEFGIQYNLDVQELFV